MAERGEQRGPSASRVLAVIALLPLGGTLLLLSGLAFAGSMIGLAVLTPIFLIFSPVLLPAAIGIGLAVTGFLSSGALGMTAVQSLSWFMGYVRQVGGAVAEYLEKMRGNMQKQAQEGWPRKRMEMSGI